MEVCRLGEVKEGEMRGRSDTGCWDTKRGEMRMVLRKEDEIG